MRKAKRKAKRKINRQKFKKTRDENLHIFIGYRTSEEK